jgi:uncharacterized protein YggE
VLSVAPLLAACASQAPPARTAADQDVRTITVVGQGEVSAKPDIARVQLGIDVTAPSVNDATKTAAARMSDILAALQKAGIAEKDIQTSNYSIHLERQERPEPMPAPAPPVAPQPRAGAKGQPGAAPAPPPLAPSTPPPPQYLYRVSNTVSVAIRNLDQVGPVIDAVVGAGANNVWGVSFGLDKTDTLEAEARAKAVADARARAEALARLQGVSLGGVLAVSEVIDSGAPMYAMKAARMDAGGGTPVSPGEVTFSTQVKVVYALEGGAAGPQASPQR